MLSQHAELHAETLLAAAAILAPPTGQPWVKNYLGADLDITDPVPDCDNNASSVRSADVGQFDWDAGHALEDEEIEVVESGGLQPHPHLTVPRFGFRPVTETQIVGPAMLLEVQSSHKHLRGWDIVTASMPHWHGANGLRLVA